MATIQFTMSKNAIGGVAPADAFEFGLYDDTNNLVATTSNDANGYVIFSDVEFDSVGDFEYTIKELSGPPNWILDSAVYPVNISVTEPEPDELVVVISYPDGVPSFKNIQQNDLCGIIEFPELSFDAAGDYEFTLKELTPSGGGWITDDTEYPIIIHVLDDGYGNLIATAEYPEGFPGFVNRYVAASATFIISACKTAIGAPLPEGRFEFGLFDSDGLLVATARNLSADPTPDVDVVVNNGTIPASIAPVTGATAQSSINTPQFTGIISWTPPLTGSAFAAETVYEAAISLTAKNGYTLDGVDPLIFTIDAQDAVLDYNPATETVTITFSATEPASGDTIVNEGTIPASIAPVVGEQPELTINTAQFTGSILWHPDPVLTDDKFIAGPFYEAEIVLTAKSGYTLDGVNPAIFSIAVDDTTIDYNASTNTLSITFPQTVDPSGDEWEITYTFPAATAGSVIDIFTNGKITLGSAWNGWDASYLDVLNEDLWDITVESDMPVKLYAKFATDIDWAYVPFETWEGGSYTAPNTMYFWDINGNVIGLRGDNTVSQDVLLKIVKE